MRGRAGVKLGNTFPLPIVDHAAARCPSAGRVCKNPVVMSAHGWTGVANPDAPSLGRWYDIAVPFGSGKTVTL